MPAETALGMPCPDVVKEFAKMGFCFVQCALGIPGVEGIGTVIKADIVPVPETQSILQAVVFHDLQAVFVQNPELISALAFLAPLIMLSDGTPGILNECESHILISGSFQHAVQLVCEIVAGTVADKNTFITPTLLLV